MGEGEAFDGHLTGRLGRGRRFEVTITSFQRTVVSYPVATRLHQAKAVAVAVLFFKKNHPQPDESVFDVSAREIGLVDAVVDAEGRITSYNLDDSDVTDFYEWA